MGYAHIQPNASSFRRWMVFDIDRADAQYCFEQKKCPEPNFITLNPSNGHAHYGYMLGDPVSFSTNSEVKPMQFYRDVELGMANRLDADLNYAGLICKNPFHENWRTEWISTNPTDLVRLNDCLEKKDKIRPKQKEQEYGTGRHVSLWEDLRKWSYREVLIFKREGKSLDSFIQKSIEMAGLMNSFLVPLDSKDVRDIARCTARWCWKEFSLERFSKIQSARGSKAWSKTETLSKSKPWEAMGISRATYFRSKTKPLS